MRRITLVLIGLLLVAAGCSTENQDKPSGSDGAGIPEASATPSTPSAEPTDLVGTTWRLSTLVDDNGSKQLPKRASATVIFTKSAVQTNSGCNSGGGSVEISDDTVVFGQLISTQMGCPEKWKQQVEGAYGDVLRGKATYAIDGDRLSISKGEAGLEFVAR